MSPKLPKSERPVKWLRVRDLDVKWVQAQRPVKQSRVTEIANNIDPNGLGVICVAEIPNRSGTTYHIIDGQHRVAAVRSLWGEEERVPCEVIQDADSPEEAAEIWLLRNTGQAKPASYDRFNVAVTARRELECDVDSVIKACGYEVGWNKLMAVESCIAVYNSVGATGLTWVLTTLRDTWGRDDREAVSAGLLRGYAALWKKHGLKIDTDRLIKNVASRYTPNRLIGAARTSRDTFHGNLADNVVRVLETTYNYRLRADQQQLK